MPCLLAGTKIWHFANSTSMVSLALYRGRGLIGNAITRFWTRSVYSHCELIVGELWYSASFMDGGVRAKKIMQKSGHWDIIPIPWADEKAIISLFDRTVDGSYDWIGLFGSQLFNRRHHDQSRYFCSEWCAEALGIPTPEIHSPHSLGELCKWINDERSI